MDRELPVLPAKKALLGIIIGFFACTLLVYGHSLHNPFVRWDDGMLVYENAAIREITPASVKQIFTTYDPELYIPLTFFTYQVDYAIGGIDPFLYHFDNLVLHTLNALLVAWVLFLLFRKGSLAIFCGLLFALHPLHTEAVEWVSARKDVLSTFFFLLTLVSYLYYRENGSRRTFILSVVFYVLGLLSKVMVITLPVVLVLIDWRDGRMFWKKDALIEKIPYLAAAAIFGIIGIFGKTGVIQSSTLSAKILMAFKSAAFYVQQIVWPLHFSLLYPYTKAITITSPDFFIPILIVLALTAVGIIFWRRGHRDVPFGLLFYIVTVAPTFLNFAKGGETDVYFASDRYAYIPSIGIFFAIAVLLWQLRERLPRLQTWIVASIASLPLLACAGLAYAQSFVWNDTQALFENVLRYYPESSHVAHNNLGNVYRLQGDEQRAITEYQEALTIRPHPKTYSNLGAAYRALGQYDLALEQYQKALALDPLSKEAHFGLGIVFAQEGKFADAEAEYRKAIAIDPSYEQAYTDLGVALFQEGKTTDAIDAYRKALVANPFFPDAHYNLAVALSGEGKLDEAISEYATTIREVSAYIPARINLALLLYKTGDQEGARTQFQNILKIDPQNAAALSALRQIGN